MTHTANKLPPLISLPDRMVARILHVTPTEVRTLYISELEHLVTLAEAIGTVSVIAAAYDRNPERDEAAGVFCEALDNAITELRRGMSDLSVSEMRCRVCGCTDDDCRGCIERTGKPCYWIAANLCSACAGRETP